MNPVQVNCPECQKLFFVRSEDLEVGQARFECTSCHGLFAFNWPQPPGITNVRARLVDGLDFKPSTPPPVAEATVNTSQNKITRACFRCATKVDIKLNECPKCGVIFDRIKKIRPAEAPTPAPTPEILSAWDAVKANYANEKRHESFIQLCLNRESLPFASHQYRVILEANPTEEIANRMQSRIIELATMTYIASQSTGKKEKGVAKGFGFSLVVILVSATLIGTGVAFAQARSLIAVGISFLVFLLTSRYFSQR